MPRLPPSLFWQARQALSPLAAPLLRVCRDLPSTANELRWMREHIAVTPSLIPPKLRLWQFAERRARGEPLQYVLGTQPFGDLEIKCRPGVLIPRPETEAYTIELGRILLSSHTNNPKTKLITILDLCTGTGCIALQLFRQLQASATLLRVQGIDISPHAVSLARTNLSHNLNLNNLLVPRPPTEEANQSQTIRFTQADIFSPSFLTTQQQQQQQQQQQNQDQVDLDLLVSNPPYISQPGFARDTARSVRNHEPRLALVPELRGGSDDATQFNKGVLPEDIFYARLLDIAKTLRPKRVLLEVASMEQGSRVVDMLTQDDDTAKLYPHVEIWRDCPHAEFQRQTIGDREIRIRGSGEGRSVYLCRADM
ncbi:S-adenosyl-L-methionine-dependent methyltransferase [Podospora didyma]|uniref:S-adenosyl-L-methionine-dependent methyltransferase n=1 Tax=Podospora didyma TaxID=330526 RepID=A0AAE0N4S7_9PEZI|nr:S-adenosyl-L-methionine-dependent methyltransferase [Podospora didyma]